jgi:OmpA-OmpF porin, OOP family
MEKGMKKKNILMVAITGLIVSSPISFADFWIVADSSTPKQHTQVVTEINENARLQAKLDSVIAELAKVKTDLQNSRTNAAKVRQALLTASAELNVLRSKIKKIVVSFVFGDTEFVPHPEVGKRIVNYAKLTGTVNVHGYTDSVGTPDANQNMALKRAIAAKKYMVSHGVEKMKVKVFGHEGEYVANNATKAGRLANRRVEIDYIP